MVAFTLPVGTMKWSTPTAIKGSSQGDKIAICHIYVVNHIGIQNALTSIHCWSSPCCRQPESWNLGPESCAFAVNLIIEVFLSVWSCFSVIARLCHVVCIQCCKLCRNQRFVFCLVPSELVWISSIAYIFRSAWILALVHILLSFSLSVFMNEYRLWVFKAF